MFNKVSHLADPVSLKKTHSLEMTFPPVLFQGGLLCLRYLLNLLVAGRRGPQTYQGPRTPALRDLARGCPVTSAMHLAPSGPQGVMLTPSTKALIADICFHPRSPDYSSLFWTLVDRHSGSYISPLQGRGQR